MTTNGWVATVTGAPLYTAHRTIGVWVGTWEHGTILGIEGMTPYMDTIGPFVTPVPHALHRMTAASVCVDCGEGYYTLSDRGCSVSSYDAGFEPTPKRVAS